jgi:hypothetical protein
VTHELSLPIIISVKSVVAGVTSRRDRSPRSIQKDRSRKSGSSLFLFPTFGRGRVLFLPALPCLPETDAAAIEEPAIAVFGHHVVRRQQMALFAGRDFGPDNRTLQSMMLRVAAGFGQQRRDVAARSGRSTVPERFTSFPLPPNIHLVSPYIRLQLIQ